MEELNLLINHEIHEKLIERNILKNLDFLVAETHKIAQICGLNNEKIDELKLKLSKLIHKPNKIIKAIELLPVERLTTGCKNIDLISRNGFATGCITEIFGCSGVGKTQVCLQLALQVQLPVYLGGFEKCAAYICTEDIFPSKRLHQLSSVYKIKYNLPEKDFESSIFIKHVPDIDQLEKCLSIELPLLLRKENIGLLVVDSIAGPFRGENEKHYLGRSKDLIEISHKLNEICEEYNMVVICTNQVSEDIDKDKTVPCLGIAWTNSINYRYEILRFNGSESREFKIIFSPDLINKKCRFLITESGLECV